MNDATTVITLQNSQIASDRLFNPSRSTPRKSNLKIRFIAIYNPSPAQIVGRHPTSAPCPLKGGWRIPLFPKSCARSLCPFSSPRGTMALGESEITLSLDRLPSALPAVLCHMLPCLRSEIHLSAPSPLESGQRARSIPASIVTNPPRTAASPEHALILLGLQKH